MQFESQIKSNNEIFRSICLNSEAYKDKLHKLIYKLIPNINISPKYLSSNSDKKILDTLEQSNTEKFSAWGKNTLFSSISQKSFRRIKEIKCHLSDLKSRKYFINYIDIGGGTGEISSGISQYVKTNSFMIVDVKDYRLECYKNLSTFEVFENFIKNDSLSSFNLITIFQTLHHIAPNSEIFEKLLDKVSSILSVGGLLIIREHDCRHTFDNLLIDAEHLIYDVVFERKKYEEVSETFEAKYFRRGFLKEKLEKFGLKFLQYVDVNSDFNLTNYYYEIYTKIS